MSENQPPFDRSRMQQHQPNPVGQPQPHGIQGAHPGTTMYATPPAPKKRRVWLWVLIGILAVFLVIVVACSAVVASMGGGGGSAAPAASSAEDGNAGASDDGGNGSTSKASAQAKPTTAKIGDTVKAGDWQFKVTDFDCGHKSVGNQYAGKKAQGQFCFLRITAKNNGDDEGTLNGDSQKLADDDGKTYSSDTEASLYEDADDMLFLEGVNPGNTAKGLIVFDVPKNAKITQVSLTGGFFGKSAEVSLR